MSFGNRLRAAREAVGYTQREVAAILGQHYTTVGSWEREDRRPPYDQISQLGKLYGVSVDYLLHGEEAAPPLSPEEQLRQLGAMLRSAGATTRDVATILDLLETRRKAMALEKRIQIAGKDDPE